MTELKLVTRGNAKHFRSKVQIPGHKKCYQFSYVTYKRIKCFDLITKNKGKKKYIKRYEVLLSTTIGDQIEYIRLNIWSGHIVRNIRRVINEPRTFNFICGLNNKILDYFL